MAWSSPPTFTTGVVATAAQLNISRDDLNFLASGSIADLKQTSTQTPATATDTPVTFDAENIDVLGGHSTVSNTSRYTSQVAAWYDIAAGVMFAANATGQRQAWLRRTLAGGGTADFGMASVDGFATTDNALQVSRKIFLAVGDYVELLCWQNSGAGLATAITHGGSFLSLAFASF